MTEASRVQKLLNEQNAEIDRLKNRIEQLEAALRKIAESMDDLPKYDVGNMYLWAVETASIALEGQKDER